ncbi:sensor histidine kinase [Limisalsivibrio acetivorans]|uniref:sensor histidine kinase n=1 Tax=Limisalsivibrio acetivorans TaxID=1304888 RepID=UPI0003B62960|nr:ATP-binding protein [Limisalsivibrio acetivorans]
MKSFVNVFLIIFLPIALILLLTFHFSSNSAMESAERQLLMEMQSKWNILATKQFDSKFDRYTVAHIQEISKNTQLRITFISNGGDVLYDSRTGKNGSYINPLSQPEIEGAEDGDFAYDIREIPGSHKKTFYLAKRYSDEMYLRIAYPMTYLEALQSETLAQNVRIFLFAFIIVAGITLFMARRVSVPMSKLSYIADCVEAGEKDIDFPVFKDKTMSKVAAIFARLYNSMEKEQTLLENERSKLNHIFSILDEGIILLDLNNSIKHYNTQVEHQLGCVLEIDKNILSVVNDFDVINFISEVINIKEDTRLQTTFRKSTYEVFIKILEDEKLIVLYNIDERNKYETFKAELIGNITHELKTPLSMIMGYAETLRNNVDIDKKNLEKFLGVIHGNSKRLNNLINDILELHRLEQTGDHILSEPMDVKAVFEELEERYSHYTVKTVFTTTVEEIGIIREHFITVATNLADNAHKYSSSETIEVSVERIGDEVELRVIDEGPAIPPEEKTRIFERFYTVNKSKNRNQTGTGLGLSIVKHIATIYGGSVTLASNSKGGNTFLVTLFEREVAQIEEE